MRNTDTLSGPTAQDTATKTYHLDESIATDLCLREGRGVTCPQSLSPRSGLQVPNGHFIVTLHGWHYPGLLGRVCGEPTNTGAWWPRKKHYKHEKTLSSVTLAMRLPLTAASILMSETGLSGTQTEIHHLLIYKKKWESIIYTLLLCPIPSRKNSKMLPWSDKYFKGGEGKGIHSGTHNHRVNVNLKPYIAFWNLSSYVKKLGETERKYLLDETDSWSAAEIVDPSRLTYQHSSPRSANCDKGPPQRTWSHLINKRQNYCN